MKNKKVIIIYILIFIFLLCGCNNQHINSTNVESDNKESLKSSDLWDKKVRFLAETYCKQFENPEQLNKEYLLKVCQYYKTLSISNLEYNEELKKYIITIDEVKDIVKNLFGIYDFEYTDSKYYDKYNGLYLFDDYPSLINDNVYTDFDITKIDDTRMQFTVAIKDTTTGVENTQVYILKKDNNTNDYFITSMHLLFL